MPAAGTTALYRPVPGDFDEVFIRLGWSSICGHYGAGWKTVVKWMAIRNGARVKAGGVPLQAARRAYVDRHGPAKSPVRADYVLRRIIKRKRMSAVTTSEPAE